MCIYTYIYIYIYNVYLVVGLKPRITGDEGMRALAAALSDERRTGGTRLAKLDLSENKVSAAKFNN